MKAFTLSALSTLFAGLTLAHPVDLAKRAGRFSEVDITILQFALTLEHLENTFYREAFATFQLQDFLNVGFDEAFFTNLQFIAADESAHVDFLIAAIQSAGVAPVQPCQYSFPVTDVASFVTVSAILESIGTSAYLGAAPFVSSREILAVAASIMATEGLHTSLQRSSLGAIGAANPFQTPLDPNSVFTLASQFIVSCPPTNPPLPFTAFPGLKVNAQPCFNEVGIASNGGFSTQSVDYATIVSAIEDATATDTATASVTEATDITAVETAASTTTTETSVATEASAAAEAAQTTTATEASTTTVAAEMTTTTDPAVASTTAAAAEKRSHLEARAFVSSCQAPGAGTSMQLIPDFSQSRGIDFSRIQVVFVTIVSGLQVVSIQAVFGPDGSITVTLPGSIGGGQVFIFITTVDISGRSLSANEILFGPAVFELAPSFPGLSL
ncbi:hypothetical protein A1O7_03793 [Cladophialophora yegresii CBS 114405]|uniref:Ferritin-like domain-containing protein n=1 Tax=Cladophialophora yegresii CBS 114405 TaxID=1182544 RepID=W9VV61_9EURO|nr:uncharacterized protein A1O7_03793 [Cladophialophora yegresii CBS 114405]EXJ59647.1 hypothetical protein A1O7_03793 [Cladophialophora yegresii CBS 114405]